MNDIKLLPLTDDELMSRLEQLAKVHSKQDMIFLASLLMTAKDRINFYSNLPSQL